MLRVALLIALFLPQLAFGAGFAKQSLFLSKSPVTEGETVFLHAVVNNDSATAFAGDMLFKDGATTIGTVPVSLDAGEAAALSVSWKPSAGSHAVVAQLMKGKDVVEKQSATFFIEPKPQPVASTSPSVAAAVESSDGIQQAIANISPAIAGATTPLFKLIDGGREALVKVVEQQYETTKQSLGSNAGNPGSVLSAETAKKAPSDPMGTLLLILRTLYFYLLTLLGFVFATAGVFYPVFAIVVLYILWKLVQRFRRPA